jgi:hypothetical protein
MIDSATQPTSGYRDRLAVWADKHLFMLLFAVGTIAIVAMKTAQFSQLSVTAVPVAVMLLYGAYILFTPRYRIRSDRAGDSLYYLGFLFTMVSLAYSLYEFRTSEPDTANIVTNFGIALSTTIIGLMLRVVYHQHREDPFDVEQETRVELSDAAARLHGTLLKAEADFEGLRLTVSQVVSEAAEDTKARVKVIAEEVEKATKVQTEFVSKFSEQAIGELREHHSELLKAARNITAALSRIAGRIDNVDVPAEAIKNKLDLVSVPPNLIKERIEAVSVPPDFIHERLKAVQIPSDIFTSRFESITNQLAAILNRFGERTAGVSESMQSLRDLIVSAASAAEQLRVAILASEKDDEERRKQLNTSFQAFTLAVSNLQASTETFASLSKAHVDEQKKLVEALANSSALAYKAIENHTRRLEEAVSKSDLAVEQVHGSLVSLTRTVVEKLNGRS